ncbi:MAG: hypothetical protein OXC67_08150 [Flavobacteriaceae bacterium]|nr:hypothetical protein [Flavobacteriaceae bacterium]MCY4298602.1 hypothetical protein [Flavobacteriaceae bacterium]
MKNDIEQLKELISTQNKELKQAVDKLETKIDGLHEKFDILNHKTGSHGSFIKIYGIVLILILSGVIGKAFQSNRLIIT